MIKDKNQMLECLQLCKEDKHDTIYCNPSDRQRLVDAVSNGLVRKSDKVAGLDVVTIDRLDTPIVCEKGEVFPLARHWKDDGRR